MTQRRESRWAWVKFGILLALIVTAAVVVHATDLAASLDFDSVQSWLDSLGPWGPVGFIVVYATLIVFTMPGTVVTVLGAALFPLWQAFGYVLVGAMLGASVSFGVARLLGRDAIGGFLERADQGVAGKLRDWTEKIEDNALLAIAYMRLAYVPFSLLNYAAPLTGVRFRDFALGTLLGILPGTFVFVFMGNTLQVVWETGSLEGLWTWRTAVAGALFLASLGLPWGAQRFIAGRQTRG